MLRYNGNAIIPTPLIHYVKENETTDDETKLGAKFIIEAKGKFVPYRGSPDSSGNFSASPADDDSVKGNLDKRLPAFFNKQKALLNLFKDEGKLLEVVPYDGSAPLTFNPRNIKIDFPDGPWVELCDYTITMEADEMWLNGVPLGTDATGYHVVKASNEWTAEPTDETARAYRIVHAVNAIGKTYYNSSGVQEYRPWQWASGYALNHVGLGLRTDRVYCSGVLNLIGFSGYDYRRQQTLNELTGQFSVTESWLAFNPGSGAKCIIDEECDLTMREDGITRVNYHGTIKGLEERNNTSGTLLTTKYFNAVSGWNLIRPFLATNASLYSGTTLNPTVVNSQVNLGITQGTISWSYDYDNRAAPLVSGALSTITTITFRGGEDVFASIPIPARPAGPVLQPMLSTTATEKSVSLEVVMPASTYTSTTLMPDTTAIIASYIPSASIVLTRENQISWTPETGRYSRQAAWIYQ